MTISHFGQPSVLGQLSGLVPTQRPHVEEHPWILSDIPDALLKAFRSDLRSFGGAQSWIDSAELLVELRRRQP